MVLQLLLQAQVLADKLEAFRCDLACSHTNMFTHQLQMDGIMGDVSCVLPARCALKHPARTSCSSGALCRADQHMLHGRHSQKASPGVWHHDGNICTQLPHKGERQAPAQHT